jgi:hypothetical protein
MSAKDGDDEEADFKEDSKFNETDFKDEGKSDKETALTDSEIVERVQQFFFMDNELCDLFENFIKKGLNDMKFISIVFSLLFIISPSLECHIVDLENEEFKLEYTEVFDRYKALFEKQMESFITRSLKVSINDFYSALKAKMDEEYSNEAIFATILIAVTDFNVFMTMMREGKREQIRADDRAGHK